MSRGGTAGRGGAQGHQDVTGRAWIERLDLEPHPEGGFFRRIYTDDRVVDTAQGRRAAVTSIQYLLARDAPIGRLHRNRSTILHYLQSGGPVEYLLIDDSGALTSSVLGYGHGHSLFLEVRGGVWKGSRLMADASHALIAEVVIPGFDHADHEFATTSLLDRYPALDARKLLPLIRT